MKKFAKLLTIFCSFGLFAGQLRETQTTTAIENKAEELRYYDTDYELEISKVCLKSPDGINFALGIFVGNSECNYSSWPENVTADYNLQLLNCFWELPYYIHLYKYNGEELYCFDKIVSVSYHQWGDAAFFLNFGNHISSYDVKEISRIVLDDCFYIPNAYGTTRFANKTKYICECVDHTKSKVWIDGQTTQAYTPWTAPFSEVKVFNPVKVENLEEVNFIDMWRDSINGELILRPITLLWNDIYSDVKNSIDVTDDLLFRYNTLSKIFLVKDKIRYPLSSFYFDNKVAFVDNLGIHFTPSSLYNFSILNYDGIIIESGCQFPATNGLNNRELASYHELINDTVFVINSQQKALYNGFYVSFENGETIVLEQGKPIGYLPEVNETFGKTFLYWGDENCVEYDLNTPINRNTYLHKVLVSDYDLFYLHIYLNDGNNPQDIHERHKYNDLIDISKYFSSKEGYTINLHVCDSTINFIDDNRFYMPPCDVYLELGYAPNSYSLFFEDFGFNVNVLYDTYIGFVPDAPYNPGYYTYWSIDGLPITNETIWRFSENKVAKISMTPISQHKVTYIGDFGGFSKIIKTVSTGNKASWYDVPYVEGYEFLGWYLDDKLFDFSTPIIEDITLEARWKKIEFKVNIFGAENIQNIKVPYGECLNLVELPKNGDLPFLYFWYWNYDCYFDLSTPIYENLELEAVFGDPYNIMTVNFDSDGGSYVEPIQFLCGDVIKDIPIPYKENCEFLGWYNNEILIELYDRIFENMTLVAKWRSLIETCEVSFNGIENPYSVTVEKGKMVERPNDPIKEGYVFLGWYNGNTLFEFNTFITKNITLTAKWQKIETSSETYCKVTFNSNGGTPVNELEIVQGQTINDVPTSTRQGFAFAGWYLNDQKFDLSTPITSDITLTAKWSLDRKSNSLFGGCGGSIAGSSIIISLLSTLGIVLVKSKKRFDK